MASILPIQVSALHLKIAGQIDLESWKNAIRVSTERETKKKERDREREVSALVVIMLFAPIITIGISLIPCSYFSQYSSIN